MLRLEGIDKTFPVRRTPVRALRDVSLTIRTGLLTSVLGASGSGKSTLLRVIAGFEHPDRGTVHLDGRVLNGPGTFVRPEHRGIGIVPQDGALFPHLDVAGNVAFGLSRTAADRLSTARRRRRAARVDELLHLVGLDGYQRRRVDQLSGGQQQRVALARALAPSPGVILLDEPFSAIDAALRAELGLEVRNLLRDLEITTVLVTHDQEEALSLADEVVVMREGRVVQIGTPREVYENPADAATARFVGDAVVLDGTVLSCDERASRVDCLLGSLSALHSRIPPAACLLSGEARGAGSSHVASDAASSPSLRPGGACRVIIRPESLRMGQSGVCAVVTSTEYYGHDAMTTLRLGAAGDGPTVRVRTSGPATLPAIGAAVAVRVADPVLVVPAD
jgi:iron(III) transport system ATP-binding protein